jgi:hypothetical protein
MNKDENFFNLDKLNPYKGLSVWVLALHEDEKVD